MEEFLNGNKSGSTTGEFLKGIRDELRDYFQALSWYLKLDPERKRDIIRELYTHLEDEVEDLCREGMEAKEAIRMATERLGFPQLIAKEFYLTYSGGSWFQAIFASIPHILCSGIFAFRLWSNPLWAIALPISILGVSLYGLKKGKPPWIFSWLGYLLLPLIGVGVALILFPPWGYIGLLAYIPLAFKLTRYFILQAVRKDWLYASLSLLPFPLLSAWIIIIKLGLWGERDYHALISEASPWIAISFLIMGIGTIAFIKSSRRDIKKGAILTPEAVILVLLGISSKTMAGFLALFAFLLLAIGLLLSPFLLERRAGSG